MDPARFEVRRGVPDDAAALAVFAARTFFETFGLDNRPEDMAVHLADSYGADLQGAELADPEYVTVLIERRGGIAAYAQVRRHPAPPCISGTAPVELYRFYVDRAWQGQGVAQRLMEEVRGVARELGGRTVWLSVWERNPRAIAFYRKCGFRDVGSTVFHLGPDAQTDRVMMAEIDGTASR